MIKEYSAREQYEECECIITAINQLRDKFKMKLPTTFDKDSYEWFVKELKEMGDQRPYFILGNIPYYGHLVSKEIKALTDYDH